MLNILRAGDSPSFQQGPFKIRRMRPGLVRSPVADPAFGPLSAVDHANLDVGTVVPMHEHRNDVNLTDPEAISEALRNRVVVLDDRESLGVCRPEPVDMRTPRELHEQEQIETALQVDWLSVFAAVMGMGVPALTAICERC